MKIKLVLMVMLFGIIGAVNSFAACNVKNSTKWTYLGKFTITNYNIANEKDYIPLKKGDKMYSPKGLDRKFSYKFMIDVDMQGTGVTKDGKYITLVSTASELEKKIFRYAYVEKITGESGRELKSDYSVAVDKAVIPLGSILCIDGYGVRQADDTGTKIKGKHIDLFRLVTRKEAMKFGTKTDIQVSKEKKQ